MSGLFLIFWSTVGRWIELNRISRFVTEWGTLEFIRTVVAHMYLVHILGDSFWHGMDEQTRRVRDEKTFVIYKYNLPR